MSLSPLLLASAACSAGKAGAPDSPGSCAPHSDVQFCQAHGAVCGAASGNDNCGAMRSVASCGTCGSGTCTSGICAGATGGPKGDVPAALPARLLIGTSADSPGDDWMASSGTRWDVRWVYFSG